MRKRRLASMRIREALKQLIEGRLEGGGTRSC